MDEDRQTILVLDGEPGDEGAVIEAATATGGAGSRLVVLLVPATVTDWAHWELGDDPVVLRWQIEGEQRSLTMQMLDAAGMDNRYRMHHIKSRWRVAELDPHLDGCEELIVSTSSRLVRRRLGRIARRNRVPFRVARGDRP
ncbi:MAG: hypothetical protein QM729_05685 [Solirubrobacterales bacterium]